MANLKENAAWESGIYQLETTDPVVGGVDGISNKQAIQLANRTSYLKGEIESLKSNSNTQLVLKRDISDSYSKTQTAALIAPKLDSAIAEATYLKKTDKIDAYTKKESDEKFALKDDLPPLATEAKAGIVKLTNTTNGNAEDATVTQKAINEKLTEMRGKVKIVDFGTVTINKRYVINNPFGNNKWASCVTIPQLLHNGKWFQSGWHYVGYNLRSTGVRSGSMVEGIVVQTGGEMVSDGSVYEGNLYGGTGTEPRLTSAKCRVLIFYVGELQQ